VHNVALFAFQQPSSQSIAEIVVLEPKTILLSQAKPACMFSLFLQSNFTLQNYNMLINTGDALT
jgi:hypothetical protein